MRSITEITSIHARRLPLFRYDNCVDEYGVVARRDDNRLRQLNRETLPFEGIATLIADGDLHFARSVLQDRRSFRGEGELHVFLAIVAHEVLYDEVDHVRTLAGIDRHSALVRDTF